MIGLRSYTKHLQTTSAMAFVGMIIYHVYEKRGRGQLLLLLHARVSFTTQFSNILWGQKWQRGDLTEQKQPWRKHLLFVKRSWFMKRTWVLGSDYFGLESWLSFTSRVTLGKWPSHAFPSVEPEIIIPLQKDDVNTKSGNACWEHIVWGNVRKYS